MNRLVSLLMALLGLCNGCAPNAESKTTIQLVTDQAVYESLFQHLFRSNYEPLYIANTTESQWFKNNPITRVNERELIKLQGVYPKLLKRLYEINEHKHPLNWHPYMINAMFLNEYYANIDHNRVEKTCYVNKRDTTVDKFTVKPHLRAYYTVSKVAFSKDKKIALLKYAYHCSPRSGSGDWLVILRLEENAWQVLDYLNNWQHGHSKQVVTFAKRDS